MRTIAILAAAIVGWFVAVLAVVIIEEAYRIDDNPVGAITPYVIAIGLAILVARLVPRSPQAQARQDRANERIASYRRG
ncbi:MAG TPA: hypothetical protein VGJ95_16545 [Pseudonocardiaceae bacterium]|jgi:hypothetical protein